MSGGHEWRKISFHFAPLCHIYIILLGSYYLRNRVVAFSWKTRIAFLLSTLVNIMIFDLFLNIPFHLISQQQEPQVLSKIRTEYIVCFQSMLIIAFTNSLLDKHDIILYSSGNSSVPTFLWSKVRIPSTPSTLLGRESMLQFVFKIRL